jgi:hypothetical protein
MVIEPKRGTYALVLFYASNVRVQTGRLGTVPLQRGCHAYLGSVLPALVPDMTYEGMEVSEDNEAGLA